MSRSRFPAVDPSQHPMVARGFDRLLTTQRPVVLANLRRIRRRHPQATPAEVIRILEKRYLAAVTTGGAAVGASAAVPGIGTGIGLVLTTVETGGFLEASALFAQSVTEVHGIAVTDADRARTLVMTLILGESGADLLRNLSAQAGGKGATQNRYWGDLITRSIPQAFVGPIANRIKRAFLRRFAVSHGTGALTRLLPFGIGAVVGGTGNHLLGRRVVRNAREAFGPAPEAFSDVIVLEPATPQG